MTRIHSDHALPDKNTVRIIKSGKNIGNVQFFNTFVADALYAFSSSFVRPCNIDGLPFGGAIISLLQNWIDDE